MLQITDEWRITTDPQNFILQKSRIVKEGKNKGEVIWSSVGFYPTLDRACKGLIRKGLKESDLQDVKAITNYVDGEIVDGIQVVERAPVFDVEV